MNFRRIVGIIIVLLGIAGIAISVYINQEVLEGKYKITNAQRKVDNSKRVMNLAPKEVQPIGDALTGSAQKKIDQGRADIVKYEAMAHQFKYGGIAFIVIGAIFIIIPRKKK